MIAEDSTDSVARRHRLVRAGRACLCLLTATAAAVAFPAAASAHVSVQPATVEGGGVAVVSFRVPNERDDASTIKVRVVLPVDRPLGSVQTTPVPGWRITTKSRALDEPIELFGSEVSSVVSEVTWSATNGGVRPGQFQDFDLSLGQLPESGQLVFKALQTYSSGDQVNWNQVAVDDSVEPEHPAPVLTLTAPTDDEAAATAGDATSPSATDTSGDDEGSHWALPVGLSVVSLVVSLAAMALAWTLGRRRPGA
jgi:periplasmic copper chaperone A